MPRNSHNNLAKVIKNIKTEQERNTWIIDVIYTRLTLSRKGKRFLKKCNLPTYEDDLNAT